MSRVVLSVLTLSVFAGCAALDSGDVQRQWTETLRELGINPVFPPREDVHVGDIYLRRGHPADESLVKESGFVPIDVLLAQVPDSAGLADTFYGARASFPETPAALLAQNGRASTGTVSASATPPPALPPRTADPQLFSDRNRAALRQVAFPDFSSITIRDTDLSAFVPVEALSIALGASASSIDQVQVKITTGESYAVPAKVALDGITEAGGGELFVRPEVLSVEMLTTLHAGQKKWSDVATGVTRSGRRKLQKEDLVYVDLITEVYYARSLDVSIATSRSFGIAAKVDPIVQADALTGGGSEPQAPSAAPSGDGEEPGQPVTVYDRADALNARLDRSTSRTSPGGDLRFTSVSDGQVSMRRTYERPIAIGFRGVTLGIDPTTGAIVGSTGASTEVARTTSGAQSLATNRLGNAILSRLAGASRVVVDHQARTIEVYDLPGDRDPSAILRDQWIEIVRTAGAEEADAAKQAEELSAYRIMRQ